MKVSIARALTVKKRVIGKINTVNTRIKAENSRIQGVQPAYDVAQLIQDRADLVKGLIELKRALQIANGPILTDIYRLAEAKTEKAFYEGLNVLSGVQYNSYAHIRPDLPQIVYVATVDQKARDAKVAELEKEIDDIQQKLDAFNATNQIEIPDFKL